VKLKLIVSLFPLSSDLNLVSALPPCEVHRGLDAWDSTCAGWLRVDVVATLLWVYPSS